MDKRVLIALWVVIGLILAGDVVSLQKVNDEGYPSRWDPRVASLVNWVEDHRHLTFDHPVDVEFLTEAEYKKTQTTDSADLTDEEKDDLALFEGQARALGLISSETHVLDDLNTITSSGTLAFYDNVDEKMVIKGTQLTVGLRVTIVHELTHALQDQAFGLDREFDTDGADTFFQALAEGDATRIENEYVESLDENEQDDYYEEQDSEGGDAEDALGDVAPALVQFFGAPYVLGEPFTTLLVAEDGVKALDKQFRHPHDSDEGLMDPFAVLDGEQTKKVTRPKLLAGEKRRDSGDFGAVSWYVVLSSFIDDRVALTAVDGWGGDSYVGYTKGGKECIRIAFEGDTAADTTEMATALNQWKAAFTENTAQVAATPTRVELDACEPTAVPKPRAESENSLALPATRLALVSELLSGGAPRNVTECVGRHFVAEVPIASLSAEGDAEQQKLIDLVTRIGRACATGQIS
jgi:hypothetical protein